MAAAGKPLAPEDRQPQLEWEQPLWALYERMSGQWRCGFSGRTGLDYGPAITLMQARGWDIDLGTALLRAIEREVIEQEYRERQQ